ncbi:MAG TPA: hypothetical protein VEJ40_08805 [Pseudolabrys sp.]|jgi:hypothetical protein|nr:hypothetical protein [Pseudolabrys sp.]
MQRPLARGDDETLAHDEAQPHQIVAGVVELLMQVGQHAEQLMADAVKTQMGVGTAEQLARQLRDRRALRDPGAAAVVGERKVRPDPAALVPAQRVVDLVMCDRFGRAVEAKAVGPDDAGRRRDIGHEAVRGHRRLLQAEWGPRSMTGR